jgi:hypothetical protein
MKVLVPPGFMAAQGRTDGLPFQLSLCTAQGAVFLGAEAPARNGDSPAKKAPHDAPCTFAGHAAQAPAPDLFSLAAAEFVSLETPAPARPRFDLSPGHGLAAPPLPARGPPSLTL